MKIRVTKKEMPEISQASTSDIAFLLLIFFISTTVFETEFGMSMVLPRLGEAAKKVKSDNVLKIHASSDGSFYIGDKDGEVPVALGDVKKIVEDATAENEDLIISIETDADAAYERMIDVLDEVKAAKAKKYSIKKRRARG